jgi:hypothetical protein
MTHMWTREAWRTAAAPCVPMAFFLRWHHLPGSPP